MALTARFLLDTSATARMEHPEVAARLGPLIEAGLVATTASLDAEALYSARNPVDYEQLWADRRMAYEYLPADDEHWRAALDAHRSMKDAARVWARLRVHPAETGGRMGITLTERLLARCGARVRPESG